MVLCQGCCWCFCGNFPLKCPIRKMLEPLQFRPGLRCQSRGRNPSLGLIPANSATHTISKAIKINGVEVNHTTGVGKAIHDSGEGSNNIREYSRPHSSSWWSANGLIQLLWPWGHSCCDPPDKQTCKGGVSQTLFLRRRICVEYNFFWRRKARVLASLIRFWRIYMARCRETDIGQRAKLC